MACCKECRYLAGRRIFGCEMGLPGGAYLDFDCILPTLPTREAERRYRCPSLSMFAYVVRPYAGEECREDAAVMTTWGQELSRAGDTFSEHLLDRIYVLLAQSRI